MTHRHQRGWLKKEIRSQGETWVLFFRTVRKSDGKRVENKIPIGLVQDFPDKSCVWAEVERQHLHINQVDFRGCVTFANLAHHYAEHELVEPTESIHPKAHTTIRGYERVLRNRLLPQWGNRVALGLEPLEVEQWLTSLKGQEGLANPTLDKMRRVMSLVYRHSQRYGLIPRNQESNPMRFVRCKTTSEYEAMILTPEQAYAVLLNLREPERTLMLLAAGTGLRISECLGLQWQDVSFAEPVIQVRRTWTCGQVGWPKSKASKGPVPLHPLLAKFMFCCVRRATNSARGIPEPSLQSGNVHVLLGKSRKGNSGDLLLGGFLLAGRRFLAGLCGSNHFFGFPTFRITGEDEGYPANSGEVNPTGSLHKGPGDGVWPAHSCQQDQVARGVRIHARAILSRSRLATGSRPLSIENIVKEVRAEIARLRQVLALLGGHGVSAKRKTQAVTAGPRRTMSAAGRKKIAAAQRARWAKIRAAKKK